MTIQLLKDCRARRFKIESLKARIAELEDVATNIAAKPLTNLPVSRGGNSDAVGNAAISIAELKEHIVEQLLVLEQQLEEVERWLTTLKPQQAVVMRLRYVDGLSWKQVAQKAGYSVEHCRKIGYKMLHSIVL